MKIVAGLEATLKKPAKNDNPDMDIYTTKNKDFRGRMADLGFTQEMQKAELKATRQFQLENMVDINKEVLKTGRIVRVKHGAGHGAMSMTVPPSRVSRNVSTGEEIISYLPFSVSRTIKRPTTPEFKELHEADAEKAAKKFKKK